jgi:hypothetical protein
MLVDSSSFCPMYFNGFPGYGFQYLLFNEVLFPERVTNIGPFVFGQLFSKVHLL